MNEIQRAKIVSKILNKTYPKIHVPLKSRNVFTLLISVLLSAQCTDLNVNNVTKNIYPKYYKPEHFVKLGRKKIEKLPGVGHKTASVVMSQVFGYPAFAVDTHIHRLAQRWGLTNGKNVIQTEKDLKRLFPKKSWNKLHLQIIYYGREFCKARDCYGITCKICTSCYPKRKKPVNTKKA